MTLLTKLAAAAIALTAASSGSAASPVLLDDGLELFANDEGLYSAFIGFDDHAVKQDFHDSVLKDGVSRHSNVHLEHVALSGHAGLFSLDDIQAAMGHSEATVFANTRLKLPEYGHDFNVNPVLGGYGGGHTIRTSSGGGVQANATWGLDRIDGSFDNTYTYDIDAEGRDYVVGVIMDTGIGEHPDWLPGQVEALVDCASAAPNGVAECVTDAAVLHDGESHGTHLAGIMGSPTYGVAKGLKMYSARVFDDNGGSYTLAVAQAMNEVIKFAKANKSTRIVLNASFGESTADPILYSVFEAALEAGIIVIVAAGNDGVDACFKSPNDVPGVINVGGTTINDDMSFFSDRGPCVHLFAPGSGITSLNSLWTNDNDQTVVFSGSSMAAPHAAGAAALLLLKKPYLTIDEVRDELIATSTADVLINLQGVSGAADRDFPADTANRLLYTLAFEFTDDWTTNEVAPAAWFPIANNGISTLHLMKGSIYGPRGAFRKVHQAGGVSGCFAMCNDNWECNSFTLQYPDTCHLYYAPIYASTVVDCPTCISGEAIEPNRAPAVTPSPIVEIQGTLTCSPHPQGFRGEVSPTLDRAVYQLIVDETMDMIFLDTCSIRTNFDTVIRVYTERTLSETVLAIKDDSLAVDGSTVCANGKTQLLLPASRVQNVGTYFITVDAADGASEGGDFELVARCTTSDGDVGQLDHFEITQGWCGQTITGHTDRDYANIELIRYVVSEATYMQFSTCGDGTDYASNIIIHRGTFPSSGSVNSVKSSCADGIGLGVRVTAYLQPGAYYIQVDSTLNGFAQHPQGGNFELEIICGVGNAAPLPATQVDSYTPISCGDSAIGDTIGGPTLVPWYSDAGTAVYEWTSPTAVSSVTISTCSEHTTFDTTTIMFASPEIATTASFVTGHVDSFCNVGYYLAESTLAPATGIGANTTLYFAVVGPDVFEGEFELIVSCTESTPVSL